MSTLFSDHMDAESRAIILDAFSRAFVAIFGFVWFMMSSLNIELGQRELTWSQREWIYFAHSMAGMSLVALSCLPRSLLSKRLVQWGFVPAILFVEFGLALMIYRILLRLDGLQSALPAGTEIVFGRGPADITRLRWQAVSAAVLGLLLVLSTARLLLPKRAPLQLLTDPSPVAQGERK